MTIISSGELALQDAGTNSSTTVTNKLYDNTMISGVDALLQIQRQYELAGGDQFQMFMEWQGDHYGYHANHFTTGIGGNAVFSFLGAAGTSGAFPSGNFRSQSLSNIGSATTSFTDGGGTTRTIRAITWGIPDASPSPNTNSKWFIFGLSGTGISNSDTTFKSIKITKPSGTQQTFTRSSASRYSSSDNGGTAWAWEYDSSGTTAVDNLGTSGTGYDVEIYGADITTSFNNGIAEEHGGADSSDVKMSDYYTNGTFLGSVSGVPSSGEIKFSDFLGTTATAPGIHTFTMTPKWQVVQLYGSTYTYSSGYYDAYGVNSGTLSDDTFPNTGTINFGGSNRSANSLTIGTFRNSSFNNTTNGTSFGLTITGSSVFTNAGFTNVKIYLNSTSASGSPDKTLARTSASFYAYQVGSVYYGIWTWTETNAFSTYFGTSSSNNDSFIVID